MDQLYGQLGQLSMLVLLLTVAYVIGSRVEKRHFSDLDERERRHANRFASTEKRVPTDRPIVATTLAVGSVVISIDYFKQFVAGLKMIFGGELSTYATLVERARREAIVRMKESSPGAHAFFGTRLETASISQGAKNSLGTVEVFAYSTAIRFDEGVGTVSSDSANSAHRST